MLDRIKVRIEGDELVEMKRHAWFIPECPGLGKRIQKYKGDKPFVFSLHELEWMVAVLDAVLKDRKGYPVVSFNPWNLEYVSKKDPRCVTCKALYQRLKKEPEKIYEASRRWRIKYDTRKQFEIPQKVFEPIQNYLFEGSFPKHMKPLQGKDKTTCRISMTLEELENMISSLNYYADQTEYKSLAKRFKKLAIELEPYKTIFK
jgi:hypothetical protein